MSSFFVSFFLREELYRNIEASRFHRILHSRDGAGDDVPTPRLLQPHAHEAQRDGALRAFVPALAGDDRGWILVDDPRVAHFNACEFGPLAWTMGVDDLFL